MITILVVDDDVMVLEVVKDSLAACGANCLSATNGAQGLAYLAGHRDSIAAAVLDLTMPGIDGFDTMDAMRNLRPDLPVLLVSGYNQQQVTQRFSGKHRCAFLHKPFRIAELHARLAALISS